MSGEWNGDFNTKGRDYATELLGPITDEIIDADRLCRLELRNGFPNFALYRALLAGDDCNIVRAKGWWMLFCREWCRNNMRKAYSYDLAQLVAVDSWDRVERSGGEHYSAQLLAESLGVSENTYRRARDAMTATLTAVLRVYWGYLLGLYALVIAINRKVS